MDAAIFLALDAERLSAPLRALWHDGHGNWQTAHEEAQTGEDRDSAWVHAYLHRKEGDQWNAEYWYRQAGRPIFSGPLADEWWVMVQALLAPQSRWNENSNGSNQVEN